MADPATYRPRAGEIPNGPGVYRFIDAHGRVIYVGKAKSLRSRLSSYFQDPAALHPRTQQMVMTAASVEWTSVSTEVESLALEYSWIKEFDPRFNVKYRDDKSYPYLAVTLGEAVPRVQVMRGAKRPGTRYFGPFSHAWAIRETVDLLLRVFPVRTCSSGVFKRAQASGRPCLLGYIDKCAAPCVGRISYEDHRALAEDFCRFVAGDTAPFVRRVEREMKQAAAGLDYERAARLRDDLGALQRVVEKNAVVLTDGTDADVFAMANDELEASVQVFHVRGGRIRGQRGWIVEKVEDLSDPELVERLLQQVYGDTSDGAARPVSRSRDDGVSPEGSGARRPERVAAQAAERADVASRIPREVLVPVLPADVDEVTTWLSGMRGSKVEVRVPQRGDKRALAETVQRNAEQALALHKSRRSGDLTTRSQALRELQDVLELADAPLRIECYDVSTLQGTHQVASMVVFEDGLARKSEYRQFIIRGAEGDGARDDTEAIGEVLTRRFRRQRAEAERVADAAPSADGTSRDGDDGARHDDDRDAGPGARNAPRDDSNGRSGEPAIPDSTSTNATISDTTISGTAISDSAISDSTISDSAISDSAISDSTISDTTISDTTISDTAISDSTISDSTFTDSTISDTAISDSTISDTTFAETTISDSTTTDTTTPARARFAYPPNLVVVDGGPPQVAAAQRALAEVGITDVALVGLAKRLEEVWLPGEDFPLVLPRASEGLYLLQRVRDEAHRVAITHHRKRRAKSMTASALDDVPGLGPAKRAALLKKFGSVRAIRRASPDEIASVPGFGPRTAQAVVEALSAETRSAPSVSGNSEATP